LSIAEPLQTSGEEPGEEQSSSLAISADDSDDSDFSEISLPIDTNYNNTMMLHNYCPINN